jgi:hypothetical protein
LPIWCNIFIVFVLTFAELLGNGVFLQIVERHALGPACADARHLSGGCRRWTAENPQHKDRVKAALALAGIGGVKLCNIRGTLGVVDTAGTFHAANLKTGQLLRRCSRRSSCSGSGSARRLIFVVPAASM